MQTTIAIDAMGSDLGPTEVVLASVDVLSSYQGLEMILVGQQDLLEEALQGCHSEIRSRIRIQHASEVVDMYAVPSSVIRTKRNSSMRVAIELVRDGEAQACVSPGNTGALMAIARLVLKMLPGIDRPAICATMPGIEGCTHMLDLGANVDLSSEQLLQFAVMGSELVSAVENKPEPRVGLLNIGTEEIKGNDRIKQASTLLDESHLNYIGFVEGTDIYTGKIDVIVCDGFSGNIAVKASEGLADFLRHIAANEFKRTLYGRFAGLLAAPILRSLKDKIDPRHYNGASLLGLRGIVIKSHGGADRVSFTSAIQEAVLEIGKSVPERINLRLEKLFARVK